MAGSWQRTCAALCVVLAAAACSSTNYKGRSVDVGAIADRAGTPSPALEGTPEQISDPAAPAVDAPAGSSDPAGGADPAGPATGPIGTDSPSRSPNASSVTEAQGPTSDGGGPAASPRAAGSPPPSGSRPTPTAPAPAPGASPPPATPQPIGPPTGPGFTASTISLGLELLDPSSSQGARLIGASSTDTGDTQKYAAAVVDLINATGGMAGRKVVPVFHTTNVVTGTWDGHAQAACAAFAEDNKVFAAVASMYQLSEVLSRCLARHGTPVILNGRAVRDDAMLAELADFLYMPSRMSANRFAGLTVDGLAEEGFFDRGAKVGLLRFDQPVQARIVNQVMRPKLAKHGVNVVAEEAVSYPDSINGFGSTSAQLSSAVLRLRAAGVTHLIPVDDHGIMCFLFMPQAESQGFRPRYGLSTNNQPFVIEDNMPAEQFKRAVGVGWVPADDVAFERNPGGNPSEDVCRRAFQKAGAQFPSRFAWSNALNYCDSLLFLKAALDKAPTLSVAGLRSAVADLADGGFVSAYTFRTAFSRDRHDGAAAYRAFRFHDDCSCVRYEGPVRTL